MTTFTASRKPHVALVASVGVIPGCARTMLLYAVVKVLESAVVLELAGRAETVTKATAMERR